jgi:bifunctional DNA-binding transcriptional regulator/antitoxin component of YhaV-PrlF toxin-antitoxin module
VNQKNAKKSSWLEGRTIPPKEIREKLGLNAYTKVIYKIEDGRLIVEPIPSIEEILKEPPLAEVTPPRFS